MTTQHLLKLTKRGFTVVELIVVIVVIAILAAITIVSYNNVQTNAKNAAIINAADEVAKSIKSYIASTGEYPLTTSSGQINACTTVVTGCMDATDTFAENTTFSSNIKNVVGSLPHTIPVAGSIAYGIRYNYYADRTFNGVSQPVVIQYFLIGQNVNCTLPRVVTSSWSAGVPSTTGYYNSYTFSDGQTRTQCIISITGPEA